MRNTLFLLIALLASCGRQPGPACEQSQSLPPIAPDYCGVVMPRNMAAPSFMVAGATHIRAEVETGEGRVVIDGDDEVCLAEAWRGRELTVSVSVWSDAKPEGVRYAPFTITRSDDEIDPILTYRLIPPGYEGWHTMGIYERDLTTYDERPIVVTHAPGDGCVNCHTPAWNNARRRLYHKRGEGGGTQFDVDGCPTFVNLKQKGLQGSYPAWHPSGRYVAFASTDTHQGFYHSSRDKIEVYDLGGNLFVYDIGQEREIVYDRFSAPGLWHTFPAFSPDGGTLYFCRARAVDMPHDADSLHYDLVAATFDPATAALGDERMVVDARGQREGGKGSVSFPRVSPDGRWLMYTVADCGTFPIWHKEADLAMIDLSTGRQADVSALNSDDVESFHNWSASSRWVVFSSRRTDGRYTRLFFAHINTAGRASKPFILPQRSPRTDIMRMDSYNIPELANGRFTE